MAEEFETGICGGSWWNNLVVNPTRPTSFIGSGGGGASICSADFGSWLAPTPSPDVVVSNNSSMNSDAFQNDSDSGGSAVTAAGGGVMIDSAALQMMGFGVGLSSPSPSSEDWNQRHHIASGNFNGSILEDEMNSCGRPLNNLIGLTNDFCIDPHQQSSLNINQAVTNSQSCATTSYGYNSLIQGLFESDSQQNPILSNGFASSPSSYGTGSSDLLLNGLSPSWSEFQNPNQNYNRPYSNGVSYWNNPSAATQTDSIRTGYLPAQNPFGGHGFDDEKPSCPNNSTKPKNEVATNSKESKSGNKKGSSTEPNFKRPRLETPSSLPTFKVRKEKLGDRITALQQLVSPFGKTDTASVLHEAIEYIKFLHDQVSVLSTPYMKNGNPIQHPQGYDHKLDQKAQKEQDLRSRGLCLVPISSTFPVAHETTADFWTPTFGGSFR